MSVYQRINGYFSGYQDTIALCPQAQALMLEETKHYPYLEIFYPSLNQIEKMKDEINSKYPNTIIVGTSATSSRAWYDVIIGIENPEIKDYKEFDEDFNINKYKLMTVKDADATFDDVEEALVFIKQVMRLEERNEI